MTSMQDVDKAFEVYCRLNKMDVNSLWPNLCFIAYIRPQIWILMKLCFVEDVHYSQILERKINNRAKDRVRNLLSPHAETLFKATVKRDGYFITKYSLIKTTIGVGSFATLSVVWDGMRDFWSFFRP